MAVICGVDIGLLNGKREEVMKEETFKNKILWYNFYHVPSGGMHSCAKYAYFSGTCAVDQPVYFIFC